MAAKTPTYLGLDLSSSGLKCMPFTPSFPSSLTPSLGIAVTASLKAVHEEAIVFDTDLPHYSVSGGVLKNVANNEVYAPVAMWIEALDLLLTRMRTAGFDFSSVQGVSGAGQQHGSVYVPPHPPGKL